MTNIKENNQEMLDENLVEVAGGAGERIVTIIVPVKLPTNRIDETTLKVYVDGVLESSLTKTIDPCLDTINLSFKATRGTKTVTTKLNDNPYVSYILNFETKTYSVI